MRATGRQPRAGTEKVETRGRGKAPPAARGGVTGQEEPAPAASGFADMFTSAQIEPGSPNPRYFQIYLSIREKILTGVLRNGDRLPSEAGIGGLFGVSRITARRAMAELVAAGLATRRRGHATTVSFQGTQQRQRGSIEDLLENLLSLGDRTSVTVVEFAYVPATPGVATALEIATGEEVQHALRIRHEDGQPLSLIETHVPGHIGRRYDRRDLEQRSMQALLRNLGIRVARAEQSFSACAALGRDARLLDIAAGSPVFRISRVVFDEDGQPVEYVTALYRSDRYEYPMSLLRSGGRWTRQP